jgi:hypothetical protein
MTATLSELESQRQEVLAELVGLGDFRPGMISVNYRRCGKANCICAQAEHPGHGPQYLWNTTQNNRSRSQVLHLGPELEKVEGEIGTYQRFSELCGQLISINEQICRLRPVPEIADEQELTRVKKTLQQKYNRRRQRKSSG